MLPQDWLKLKGHSINKDEKPWELSKFGGSNLNCPYVYVWFSDSTPRHRPDRWESLPLPEDTYERSTVHNSPRRKQPEHPALWEINGLLLIDTGEHATASIEQTAATCNRTSLTHLILEWSNQTQKRTFLVYKIPKWAELFHCLDIRREVSRWWELGVGTQNEEAPGSLGTSCIRIRDTGTHELVCKKSWKKTLRPACISSYKSVKYTRIWIK